MKRRIRTPRKYILILLLILVYGTIDSSHAAEASFSDHAGIIRHDYSTFYLESESLLPLAAITIAAGGLANGPEDADLQRHYQQHIRNDTTDSLSDIFKIPGSAYVMGPVLLATHIAFPETRADTWAEQSLRALAVGAPAGLLLQHATGGGRPSEGGSEWRFLRDDNGLSGHAFVGGVTFITAAKMSSGLPSKSLFYALSVLPALSRINDNKHYFSQAALGWSLSYLSCAAVERSDQKKQVSLKVVRLSPGGTGLVLERRFN
jgi:hypothetical protein